MPKLVTKSNIPSKEWELPGPGYAISPFKGCSANCAYCWARDLLCRTAETQFRWQFPELKRGWRGDIPIPQLASELDRLPYGNVLLCATCDLYDPAIPDSALVTKSILSAPDAVWERDEPSHSFWILTKRAEVVRDIPLFLPIHARVGLSITGLEARPEEPGASPNPERIEALRQLHKAGVWTFASIEPWLPGEDPIPIIEAVAPYAQWIILGSLNRKKRPVDPSFYAESLPRVTAWLEANGLASKVFIKPELRRCIG